MNSMNETRSLDRLISENIGLKTPKEIAALAGVTPGDVLRRKDELFDEIDVLTTHQKKQKLLIDLQVIAQDALERAKNMPDEYYAGALNASVNAQKEILKQLENYDKYDAERVEQLNRLRVREIVRLISYVLDALVPILEAKYGVDRNEIEEMTYELLEVEASRLDAEAVE